MDDGIEVVGLEALRGFDKYSGEPRHWVPRAGWAKPEPEGLALTLRYRGQEYHAMLLRSVEGARELDVEEHEMPRLVAFFEKNTGWIVRVWGSGKGVQMVHLTYPTLEAAILGALSMPPLLWRKHAQGSDDKIPSPPDRPRGKNRQ
jgi:hypothetical protein